MTPLSSIRGKLTHWVAIVNRIIKLDYLLCVNQDRLHVNDGERVVAFVIRPTPHMSRVNCKKKKRVLAQGRRGKPLDTLNFYCPGGIFGFWYLWGAMCTTIPRNVNAKLYTVKLAAMS